MQRPDPDQLLAHVQAEERSQARGKLKIFLGYVAGVGKTYAMLEAAHQRKTEGVDVVVAYAETHGRIETQALLDGLPVIERRHVEYHAVLLQEMDVDAVFARRPQLALVDELAHRNAPDSRHPKRFQDVEDMLDAGIDVYTTLNVQHLESLNDVVAQITGSIVRETVPDRVLDEATEIEIIDLPPDELLQRLKDGKVYIPEQAALAIEKFFRKGNLTALREMTLRRAAERVDDQMRTYMQTRAISGPWPASERLLLCVGPGPLSERMVRAARRLADELKAEWFAVYVETSEHARLSPAQRDQLARTLQLAETLGAQTLTLPGHSIAETILAHARKHNVTKIIAGKPLHARWLEWLRGSIVDQVIRASGPIDVYIISGERAARAFAAATITTQSPRSWPRYAYSSLWVAVATLLGEFIRPFLSPTNLVMLYLAIVVIAAIYLGRGPSILASILGVLAFDFFFVPPRFTFAVSDTEYLLTFLGLFVVGIVISTLTVQVRNQAESAYRREAQTAALYAFSRSLAAASGLDEIVRVIVTHVDENFGRETVVLLPKKNELSLHSHNNLALDENEMAVASWSFDRGQIAGYGTDTLPSARMRYLPFKTAHSVVGVLGVTPAHDGQPLTSEQRRLMEAFASQAAVAIERALLAEQARQAELLQATEKLQSALLNSISHDLRTPLVSITGTLSSLQEDGLRLDDAAQRSLIDTAREEAERLNRLVGNLLSMTRIESGAMKVAREPCDVQDVIGATFDRLAPRLADHPVRVDVPSDLPLAPMDFVLIEQVLANLLDNALKYSEPHTPIDVSACVAKGWLQIEVADRGNGIPTQDLEHVFDKFYRAQQSNNVGGTGLGLSICKGIVEAHGGHIEALNRPAGGTIVRLALPLMPAQELPL